MDLYLYRTALTIFRPLKEFFQHLSTVLTLVLDLYTPMGAWLREPEIFARV